MKRNLIFLLFITIIGLISCSEQSTKTHEGPQYGDPPVITYDSVGSWHNQALAFTYQILAEKQVNGNLTNADSVWFYSYNSMLNFFQDSIYYPIGFESIATDNFDYVWNNFEQIYDSTKLWTIDVEDSLSETQKNILIQLDSIIDNGNLLQILSGISEFESLAQSELNEYELPVIMSALSIAKYSLNYWYENLSTWQQLPYLQNIKKSKVPIIQGVNWKKVAKSDIANGVGGAVGGLIVGGWQGAAIGAAAGAAGGSASSIVSDLLDTWWP